MTLDAAGLAPLHRALLAGARLSAHAWVYPEHRDIAVLAVEGLDPERRALFERLWCEARAGHESACANSADGKQGVAPACIDWAAMSAIAGDHSCSSENMLDNVSQQGLDPAVADVAAQLKLDLSRIAAGPAAKPGDQGSPDPRHPAPDRERGAAGRARERVRVADTRLQRADPEYATRAGSNNAHFLLARPDTDAHAERIPGRHAHARLGDQRGRRVRLVSPERAAEGDAPGQESFAPAERATLSARCWPTKPSRCTSCRTSSPPATSPGPGATCRSARARTTTTTRRPRGSRWSRRPVHGPDGRRAHAPGGCRACGEAVRISLEQLLDTPPAVPNAHLPYAPAAPAAARCLRRLRPRHPRTQAGGREGAARALRLGVEILRLTPVPSLGPGLGAMPRFRAEVGPFIGVAGAMDVRYLDGGFTGREGSGYVAGADLSLRVGLGLDGVIGEAATGWYSCRPACAATPVDQRFRRLRRRCAGGSLTAAIPGALGLNARLRMPFYLIPGDLLLLSPMYFLSPTTYTNMAVTAGNGGLIPWQAGWATRFGRFQFVLGRELGATFYGELSDDTVFAGGEYTGIPAHHRLQVDVRGPADTRVPSVPRFRPDAVVRGDLPTLRGHRRAPQRARRCPRRRVGDPVRPRLFAGCPDHLRLAALLLAAPIRHGTGL